MRTALITGATAGIGAAFARRLAADGYRLVLVARNADRLDENAELLSDTYGIGVETLPADLSEDAGCAAVESRLSDKDVEHPVDFLVNNAGIGLKRGFFGAAVEDEERLLRLNVRAVMRLTHAAVPSMLDRGWGAVVNVSSIAGFGPAMPGSTYPASKAWVTTFSEAQAIVLQGKPVRIMALCPGWVRTEFHRSADIDTSPIPDWLWLDADALVDAALRDLDRGRIVSVPSVRYRILSGLLKHLPRPLLYRALSGIPERLGRGGID